MHDGATLTLRHKLPCGCHIGHRVVWVPEEDWLVAASQALKNWLEARIKTHVCEAPNA